MSLQNMAKPKIKIPTTAMEIWTGLTKQKMNIFCAVEAPAIGLNESTAKDLSACTKQDMAIVWINQMMTFMTLASPPIQEQEHPSATWSAA
jgi:hypothetical protein